jgi:hypothetical protein
MPRKKPTTPRITLPIIDMEKMAADFLQRWESMTPQERADKSKELEAAYPAGFTERDEANALIAMAVRNGPIENLHAGKYSALLEDQSLSRITDDEMMILILNATAVLAALNRLKASNPDLYNRMMKTYGKMYCQSWKRE